MNRGTGVRFEDAGCTDGQEISISDQLGYGDTEINKSIHVANVCNIRYWLGYFVLKVSQALFIFATSSNRLDSLANTRMIDWRD